MGFSFGGAGKGAIGGALLGGPLGAQVGGLLGGLGGGGGLGGTEGQEVTGETRLAAFQQPFVERSFTEAEKAFREESPLAATARGDFLGRAAPITQEQISLASQPLVEQFREAISPQLQSDFARAGRFGSGAQFNAQQAANRQIGRQLSELATGISGQAFDRERGFQQRALEGTDPLDRAAKFADIVSGDFGRQQVEPVSRPGELESTLGQVGGIAQTVLPFASLFAASDERIKDNIVKIGELKNGIGVYNYTFKGSNIEQMGVMAQEVKKVLPAAVMTTKSGYMKVDYNMVMREAA